MLCCWHLQCCNEKPQLLIYQILKRRTDVCHPHALAMSSCRILERSANDALEWPNLSFVV